MLASLTFLAPSLLVGIAAAAIPIVIHLMLRPRPRRLRFPPVTFLASALASGKRAQRVRDTWLLTARATLLGLFALLLAEPTCTRRATSDTASGPIAAAIVLDDSWSTRYRLDESGTILDRCVAMGERLLLSSRGWPQPSALGFYSADPSSTPIDPATDVTATRDALAAAAAANPHAAPLGRALREAARGMAATRQSNRRIAILTDLAAHAWRDVQPGVFRGIENLTVRIVCPHGEPRSNLAIRSVSGPATLQPMNTPGGATATVLAEGLAARASLRARRGNELVQKQNAIDMAAGESREIGIQLPGLRRGTYWLAVDIEPADRLIFDQTRYLAWQTGPRARVWLVSQNGPEDNDLSITIIRNLLAPESLEGAEQPLDFQWLDPSEIPAAAAKLGGERVDLIVLLPLNQLADVCRQTLLKQVESGAALLLVCSSSESQLDWPGLTRVFSTGTPKCERLDAARTFDWDAASPFAGERIGLDELPRAFVRRRLLLDPLSEGVLVHARFGDQVPAILSKRLGRGELYLMASSPDPAWSELGIRAGGLLTWLHTLIGRTQAAADRAIQFTIGESLRSPIILPRSVKSATLISETEITDEMALRPVDGRIADLPIRVPGAYAIKSPDSGPAFRIAANWPGEESELAAISPERIRELLGVDEVRVGDGLEEEQAVPGAWWLAKANDPLAIFSMVLMAVLTIEVWLSRRAQA